MVFIMHPQDHLLPRIERAVLWVTTFLFPILVLPGITHDEFRAPKMALLVLGVGVAGAAHLFCFGLGIAQRMDRRMLAIGGVFIGCLTVSWISSDLQQWSLMGQYYRYQGLLPYALFFLYGLLITSAFKGRAHLLAWALVLAGALTGAYSIVQTFHLDPVFPVSTGSGGLQAAFSFIGQSNFSGGWHAIVLPISLGLFLSESDRRRDLAAMASVLIALGVLFSFSQGGWVAALGGGVAFFGMILGRSRPAFRTMGLTAATFLGVFLVAVVVSVMMSARAGEFFEVNVQARAWGWQAAVDSWKVDPLVGRGPNTFALFSYQHAPIEERVTALAYLDDPHSVPLFFLASSGIVGAIGYSILLFAFLKLCTIAATRRSDPLLMGLAAGVIAYGIQILVSIDDPTLRLAFWAAAGVVLASYPEESGKIDSSTAHHRRRAFSAFVATSLFLGASVMAWRIFEADRQMRIGLDAALNNQGEEAVDAFGRATELRDDAWYRYLSGKNAGELATRRAPQGDEYFREMRRHFSSSPAPRHPRDLFVEGLLTNVWAQRADSDLTERATRLIRQAHLLDPWNLIYGAGLADSLVESGNPSGAVTLLEAYIPYNPDNDLFWGSWALANAAAGHHQEAWETIHARDLPVADSRVRRALELLIE